MLKKTQIINLGSKFIGKIFNKCSVFISKAAEIKIIHYTLISVKET